MNAEVSIDQNLIYIHFLPAESVIMRHAETVIPDKLKELVAFGLRFLLFRTDERKFFAFSLSSQASVGDKNTVSICGF